MNLSDGGLLRRGAVHQAASRCRPTPATRSSEGLRHRMIMRGVAIAHRAEMLTADTATGFAITLIAPVPRLAALLATSGRVKR